MRVYWYIAIHHLRLVACYLKLVAKTLSTVSVCLVALNLCSILQIVGII